MQVVLMVQQSGAGEAGPVNAAATDGTPRPLTEALLKGVIADCWNAGATPTIVMCGSGQKQEISTFTGNATRYKEAEDSKLNAAIRIYQQSLGSPNRSKPSHACYNSDGCRLYTRCICLGPIIC